MNKVPLFYKTLTATPFFCKTIREKSFTKLKGMALTRFEYVKSFELEDKLEPLHWIVIRVSHFNDDNINKGNIIKNDVDKKLAQIMVHAAHNVITDLKDLKLAYGYDTNFNFIFSKDTLLYKRRGFKLLSSITSQFTSLFTLEWRRKYGGESEVPVFEGSIYLFPQDQCLRDFLVLEQHNCHELNLKRTLIWNMLSVANIEYKEALKQMDNTNEGEKNEFLYSVFGVNYNNEPIQYKKGTLYYRPNSKHLKLKGVQETRIDFNNDDFWQSEFRLDESIKKNSKFSYLEALRRRSPILPHTWVVVRVDGKAFHKFSEKHVFAKPNDERSLQLMTAAAQSVLRQFPASVVAYGQSDEYSFVLRRYGHRYKDGYALLSQVASAFTRAFVAAWSDYFTQALLYAPSFDARVVLYPTDATLRHYLSWRQADCHINNLYNTCFWKLVLDKGMSRRDAQEYLKGTVSKDKLAILSSELATEYGEEEALFRKGTMVAADDLNPENVDIIQDDYWRRKAWILSVEAPQKDERNELKAPQKEEWN